MTEMQFKVVLVNVDLGAHITEKSSIAFFQVKLDPGTPTIYSELGFFSLSLSSVWLHPRQAHPRRDLSTPRPVSFWRQVQWVHMPTSELIIVVRGVAF